MRIEKNRKAGFTRVELIGAAIVCVVLAAVAIPNLIRAREAAQADTRDRALLNSLYNNLRLLEVAKEQWIFENKKSSSDVVTTSSLLPYFRNGQFPAPVAGEVYASGTTTDPIVAILPYSVGGRLDVLTVTSF